MGQLLDEVVERLRADADELRRRGIVHLAVFGSVARGEARPDSDVDIAIDIDPERRFSLIAMEDARLHLQDMLGRKVDLGEIGEMPPHVSQNFERDHFEIF